MKTTNLVTNIALGCCLGVSSSFGTGHVISPEEIQYYNSYQSALSSEYAVNTFPSKVENFQIIDISSFEANQLIQAINTKLDLKIDNYFIPNKDNQTKNTLFLTCKIFRDYCDNEQFKEAHQLEININSILIENISDYRTLSRVAFL